MKMGEESYEMGLNGFSDLSREEFQQLYLSGPVESYTNFECTGSQAPTTDLPSSIDWSEKGMIFFKATNQGCSVPPCCRNAKQIRIIGSWLWAMELKGRKIIGNAKILGSSLGKKRIFVHWKNIKWIRRMWYPAWCLFPKMIICKI